MEPTAFSFGWDVEELVPWRVWEMLDLDNFLV